MEQDLVKLEDKIKLTKIFITNKHSIIKIRVEIKILIKDQKIKAKQIEEGIV